MSRSKVGPASVINYFRETPNITDDFVAESEEIPQPAESQFNDEVLFFSRIRHSKPIAR